MNIVIAVDSFKGSLSSMEAGIALKDAIYTKYPQDNISIYPVADGGEGTVDSMVEGMKGYIESTPVMGPLGFSIASRFGVIPKDNTAVIEMADAAGLTMVAPNMRNPLNTTTYGLGQLILAAVNKGCRNFIIGIGGSATNDCGLGMLSALGVNFTDVSGNKVGIFGRDLADVSHIDLTHVPSILKECHFKIACDVTNPLCGEYGCSAIYGPQKGATPEIVAEMDSYIEHFAHLAENTTQKTAMNEAGAGAAGGLGFAFKTFFNGELTPGIDLIMEVIDIKNKLQSVDIVITGEGRMDYQTAMGKAPVGIAALAKKYSPNCRVIALCGCCTPEAYKVNEVGIDAYFSIIQNPMTIEEAMDKETAKENMKLTICQVLNLLHN